MTPTPFDQLAANYDAHFTNTRVGRRMRGVVWKRCDALFPAGSHVLELNCGTGEDAVRLAQHGVRVTATDASAAMVEAARTKVTQAHVASLVDVQHVAIEHVGPALGEFDGLLSDFGGLNCVADLRAVADRAASVVRHGAPVLLCVMGPCVPWEWAWFLGRGDLQRAFCRLKRGGTPWRGTLVRYPTIGSIRRAFAPTFRLTRLAALGVLSPPPFAESWTGEHPRLTRVLERCERTLESKWPLPWLADHVIVELERRAS